MLLFRGTTETVQQLFGQNLAYISQRCLVLCSSWSSSIILLAWLKKKTSICGQIFPILEKRGVLGARHYLQKWSTCLVLHTDVTALETYPSSILKCPRSMPISCISNRLQDVAQVLDSCHLLLHPSYDLTMYCSLFVPKVLLFFVNDYCQGSPARILDENATNGWYGLFGCRGWIQVVQNLFARCTCT